VSTSHTRPSVCLTCRSGPGVRRGNCRSCYDRYSRAVRKGKATWAELERRGLAAPVEARGQKWMAGFDRWMRAGQRK
jgi:hypothetical protein